MNHVNSFVLVVLHKTAASSGFPSKYSTRGWIDGRTDGWMDGWTDRLRSTTTVLGISFCRRMRMFQGWFLFTTIGCCKSFLPLFQQQQQQQRQKQYHYYDTIVPQINEDNNQSSPSENVERNRVSYYMSSTRTSTTKTTTTTNQEILLQQRGILEESLMSKNSSPLLTIPYNHNLQSSHDLDHIVRKLREDGVVRIDSCLSDSVADSLRNYVLDLEFKSRLDWKTERFARVLLSQHRSDLKLPLGPDCIMAALFQLMSVSPVGRILSHILGTNSTLYECSCLISHPGSMRQNIHPDHPYTVGIENDQRPLERKDHPMVITVFVALQDIHAQNGPTIWIPGTHTAYAHDRFQRRRVEDIFEGESPKDHLLRTTPHVVGCIPKGSCVLFDSRILHCGTANHMPPSHPDLEHSRAIFYVSFLHPQVRYPGNVGSIGYGLKDASITLEEMMYPLLRDSNKLPWEDLYQFP
jgi:hypothetical protein